MSPRISALIATRKRPHLIGTAVRSVLEQSVEDTEVIVVVDGPDPETAGVLSQIRDSRLRVHVAEETRGQAVALNCAAALARGEWIAFLDDDDFWLREKLERQLDTALSSGLLHPIVGCRFLARDERGERIWPRREPRNGESAAEYLFCRSRLSFGEAILPTSVLFTRAALLRQVPMLTERHCDLDWIVRAARVSGTGLRLAGGPEALAVWNMESGRERMSNHHNWRYSYEWMRQQKDHVTPRAYAGFLLTWASYNAKVEKDRTAFRILLSEAWRNGRPNLTEIAVHLGIWALPEGTRAALSRRLAL